MKKFRPKRAADFQEMVWWCLVTSNEQVQEMHKLDKPRKEAAYDNQHSR